MPNGPYLSFFTLSSLKRYHRKSDSKSQRLLSKRLLWGSMAGLTLKDSIENPTLHRLVGASTGWPISELRFFHFFLIGGLTRFVCFQESSVCIERRAKQFVLAHHTGFKVVLSWQGLCKAFQDPQYMYKYRNSRMSAFGICQKGRNYSSITINYGYQQMQCTRLNLGRPQGEICL